MDILLSWVLYNTLLLYPHTHIPTAQCWQRNSCILIGGSGQEMPMNDEAVCPGWLAVEKRKKKKTSHICKSLAPANLIALTLKKREMVGGVVGNTVILLDTMYLCHACSLWHCASLSFTIFIAFVLCHPLFLFISCSDFSLPFAPFIFSQPALFPRSPRPPAAVVPDWHPTHSH